MRLLGLGAVAAAVVVTILVLSGGTSGHTLVLEVGDARFLNAGAPVRLAGRPVGRVKTATATRDGRARLVLEIDDNDAWPLPAGTHADFRWPSTIAFSNRYVSLVPPASTTKGVIADGGSIPSADVTPTVELDRVVSDFDASSRHNLSATIQTSGAALDRAREPLTAALDAAPPALQQADAVLTDLGAQPDALQQLITSADTVAHAVRTSNPDVGELISGAEGTFRALSDRATQLQTLLGEIPSTLDVADRTLSQADDTLQLADDVTHRLAPGVAQLRQLVDPLNGTLRSLLHVGPDARAALGSLRRATPQLNPLLNRVRTVMPDLQTIGVQGTKAVNCIRPYSPEIGNFAVIWNGFNSTGDDKDRWFQAKAVQFPVPVASPLTPKQVTDLFPGLEYAFPRPPGYGANQPWFQPKCNLGPDTLDPASDPEARG